MNQLLLPLLRAIALVWLTLGMSVPVSAWTIHDAVHDSARVDVDAHHHHGDGGKISVHEHEDGETPDGGHDHMPSILLGAITVPQAGVALAEPPLVRQTYAIPASHGVASFPSDGPRRPPRIG